MALLTAKKTGKASEAATWTPEEAASSTSELVVPTGITVTIAAALTVINAKTEGTGTFNLEKNLTLSGSGNSLNLGGANLLGSAKVVLSPGTSTTTEPITNGATIPALTLSGANATSKIKLKENLTVTGLLLHKGGAFITENHEVTVGSYEAESATAKELTLGSSLFKCTASGGFSAPSGITLTLAPGTSTVELTSASSSFNTGGRTFNNVTVKSTQVQFTESGTYATLSLSLGGAEAERQATFAEGTTTTITSFTTSAGVKLISGTPAKAWKIKAAGTITLEGASIKDSTAETGTFKDVNGTDAGGNTGWTFETVAASHGPTMLI